MSIGFSGIYNAVNNNLNILDYAQNLIDKRLVVEIND